MQDLLQRHRAARHALAALVASLLAILAACASAAPRALVPGTDSCGYCRMTVTDVRFGAQAIAPTGKVTAFDAIECLAGYAATADSTTVRSLWVGDFEHRGAWLPATRAVYVRGASVASPMGKALLALAPGTDAAAAARRYGGTVRSWAEIVAEARATPMNATAHDHAH